MIRVLVVLPLYGGSLPIGRFAAQGLQEAGCLVDTFEAPDFYGAFSAIQKLHVATERAEFLENSFLQVISQAILAKVEAFKPDLVLCLAQAPMSRQTLKKLRADNITTAMWFVEDYKLFTYWQAYAPYYDFFAVIQKEPFLSELESIGVTNALYLPLAALPSFHKHLELSAVEKKQFGSDLSFLGAGYPNRQEAFAKLTHYDFKIWGTEWEQSQALAPLVQRKGQRISAEEAVKIYNATTININLHSSVYTDKLVSEGDFVNPRTFELAACGAFQLVDKRSLMPELFEQDELVTFESLQELENLIQQYKNNPQEREAISRKAQEKVYKEHTYAKRMQTLLNFISSKLPEFGKKAELALPDSFTPQEKEQLQELITSLQLPPHAPFADIITAIRQKNTQLLPLETALLFLDEWQKLYLPKN